VCGYIPPFPTFPLKGGRSHILQAAQSGLPPPLRGRVGAGGDATGADAAYFIASGLISSPEYRTIT
jgi:hypothetical protein